MRAYVYVSLGLVTVFGTFIGAHRMDLGQDSICYLLDQSGDFLDLSGLCNQESDSSLNDKRERAAALFEESRILGRQEKYHEALEMTDQVLALYPDYADAYVYRGVIYGLMRNPQTAIEQIREGEAIFKRLGEHQKAEVAKQFADEFQSALDSGQLAEEWEEERRIAEEQE